MKLAFFFASGVVITFSCANRNKIAETDNQRTISNTIAKANNDSIIFTSLPIQTGASQTEIYISSLKNKKLALVVNQTSAINQKHIVDSFLNLGLQIVKIFAPEHGFRGDHGAGAKVASTIDPKTKLPIISLYGNHKKPTKADLAGIDQVVFDIQDVGTRFYTYLSTLHYIMESCAEFKIPVMVLDRPNPNGFYIDGPILESANSSFVGMHPIPVVHGMTLGELAQMINGEGWLNNKIKVELQVIKLNHYHHNRKYILPIKPSPNLPTQASIYLYPSLCFFEGTNISVGRGTDKPFECFGRPGLKEVNYTFIPKAIPGIADNPPFVNQMCNGVLLTSFGENYLPSLQKIYLEWLILTYKQAKTENQKYFNDFFIKLAGTDKLRQQIEEGKTQKEIQDSWKTGLDKFKKQREPYMLYGFKENAGLFD